MSRKLREARRIMAGLEKPAPGEEPKQRSKKGMLVDTVRGGLLEFGGRRFEVQRPRARQGEEFFIDTGNSLNEEELERLVRYSPPDEIAFYANPERAGDSSELARRASGLGELSPIQIDSFLAFASRPPAGWASGGVIGHGTVTGRTASRQTSPQTPRGSTRRGYHPHDASFVSAMQDAARAEGWRLESPRNAVPQGLTAGALEEFRRWLAGNVHGNAVAEFCLFFGFMRTRCFVIGLSNPDTRGLLLVPIPYIHNRIHICDTQASSVDLAKQAAFQMFERYSR